MKKAKTLSALLCIVMAFSLLAGCTGGAQSATSASSSVSVGSSSLPTPDTRTVVDMASREVTIPYEVGTAFSTGAVGTIVLYTIDPSAMVGVNYEFNDAEKAFILPEYQDLPAYGQGDGLNLEAVMAAEPDVLVIYGSISDSTIADTDDLQEQTGIPCIMLDGALTAVPSAYRLMGEVLAQEDRCEQLAQYAEEALAFADSIDVPEADRVSVYYGNGIENLETAPQGSSHAELFELVKANNVAVVEGEVSARIDVSAEQVIGWNPDVIILNGEPKENISPADAVESFLNNPNYANVKAVQDGKVYAIPKYPFSWFDRPPGPNRLIGIYWLTGILYPEIYTGDIKEEAQEFYSLYYHMELTDEQLTSLLGF